MKQIEVEWRSFFKKNVLSFERIKERMNYLYGMIILILLGCTYVIWQYFELKKFEVTEYDIETIKLKEDKTIIVLADLHLHVYGKENDILLAKIKDIQPDMILIPGDLIVANQVEKYEIAYQLLEQLSSIAPIYFSNGNHEARPKKELHSSTKAYLKFEESMQKLGVHILNNQSELVKTKQDQVYMVGLDLSLDYYNKGKTKPMEPNTVTQFLGKKKQEEIFCILLAHNPAYAKEYAAWGADLTVCGHNHGGLVRLPNGKSIVSPQFDLFPKYNAGKFQFEDNKHVIISRGLGTHTFHIRIFNCAELVCIKLHGRGK